MVDPVAAPPLPGLARRLLSAARAVLAGIALAIGLFLLAGWIGSAIPRNSAWREPAQGITIMVETNGTHTGIVMPIRTRVKDWRATFPEATYVGARPATHIAIGWGEREVFLNVPTWGDLAPLTALRIASVGGTSVLRVSPYIRPAPSEYHRPLRLTEAQYRQLVRRVEASLAPLASGGGPKPIAGTDPFSIYYPARGRYTMARTCNTWVGDALADAGVRMGAWTPFAGGVMKWIDPPAPR